MPPARRKTAPRRAKKTTKKSYPRRKRSTIARPLSVKQNYASCVETLAFEDIVPNTMNHFNISLGDFSRAPEIASNYQFYRLAKLEWKYESLYNVYGGTTQVVDASTGGAITSVPADTLPQFYYMMNRTGNLLPKTLPMLQEMGAKPTPFVHNKTIAYKPNTLLLFAQGSIQNPDPALNQNSAKLQFNAWIPTEDSLGLTNHDSGATREVPYFGHDVFIDQIVAGNNNKSQPLATIARVSVVAHWEFKLPMTDQRISTGAEAVIVAKPK